MKNEVWIQNCKVEEFLCVVESLPDVICFWNLAEIMGIFKILSEKIKESLVAPLTCIKFTKHDFSN